MPTNDPMSIQRGDYAPSILPKALFAISRLASGPLQCLLIQAHPLSRFGIPPPPTGPSVQLGGHSYGRLPLLAVLMPSVLGAKHALWISLWGRERMTLAFALFGVLLDGLYESVSTLVFTAARRNPLFAERQFYLGAALFFAALALELTAELHRAAFKARPANQGRLCTTGLWRITRHINYTANVLLGFGAGLAAGGVGYALATSSMYLGNFTTNALPSIEGYCRAKYDTQWRDYERQVPWKLIPYVY